MPSNTLGSLSSKNHPLIKFPFKTLVLISLILFLAAGLVVFQTKQQEEARLFSDMKSRADMLIWALESGARSMGLPQFAVSPISQEVLEEAAKQPAIISVAILDQNGIAIAHSTLAKSGLPAPVFSAFNLEAASHTSQVLLREADGVKRYEIMRAFTFSTFHRGGMEMHERMAPDSSVLQLFGKKFYIVVCIDASHFMDGLETHIWHFVIIAFLLLILTVSGISLLFFGRNLSISKKMLYHTQLLASQMFERLPIGVFTTDEHGMVTLCNRLSSSMLGFDEPAHAGPAVWEHPWLDWKGFVQSIKYGVPVLEHEVEFVDKGGRFSAVSVRASRIAASDGNAAGYLFIVRDLVEVKKLQKQVRLNERLTALGSLAAGVAHEMRNPLSSVKGYATLLAGRLKNSPGLGKTAHMMLIEVERLNRVVSDLLGMASPGVIRVKPVTLRPILERIVRLAKPEADDKGVAVAYTPAQADENELAASLDEDRIVQALLNLAVNAVQATDAGGDVRVSLRKSFRDGPTGEEAVIISVADTGSGISSDVLANIFTPYFTTKPSGTGLGLAIAHRIVEQHGGEITVSSKPGKGSVFNVHLPVSREAAKE